MPVDGAERGAREEPRLQPGPKQRHTISPGPIIGAGLFVGSGEVINHAEPAADLAYALVGLVLIPIMRMLGEMAFTEGAAVRLYLTLVALAVILAAHGLKTRLAGRDSRRPVEG